MRWFYTVIWYKTKNNIIYNDDSWWKSYLFIDSTLFKYIKFEKTDKILLSKDYDIYVNERVRIITKFGNMKEKHIVLLSVLNLMIT